AARGDAGGVAGIHGAAASQRLGRRRRRRALRGRFEGHQRRRHAGGGAGLRRPAAADRRRPRQGPGFLAAGARTARQGALCGAEPAAMSVPAAVMKSPGGRAPLLRLDPLMLLLVAAILLLGLVMVTSASVTAAARESGDPFAYLERQLVIVSAGLALAALVFL